jgi:tetratricopeptide (TPR) repeat protein
LILERTMTSSKSKELIQVEELVEAAKFREAFQIINNFKKLESFSPLERVSWYILKSRCLNRLGQFEEAFELAEDIYKESQDLEEPIQSLDVLIELSEALTFLGRLDKVIDLIAKADILFKKIEGKPSRELKKREASMISIKGYISFQMGEINKFLEYAKQSHKLQEELGNKHEIARSLVLLKNKIFFTGEWDQALESLNKCLVLEGEGFNFNIAMIMLGFVSVYFFKGELDYALNYCKKSLALCKEMNSKLGIAISLNFLGDVYQLQGDFKKAIEHFKQSLVLFEDLGNLMFILQINSCLFALAIDMEDHEKAQLYLNRLKEYKDINKLYNSIYLECKALLLKLSPRAINRGKAEEIFKQLVNEEGILHESKEIALVNLCDLLLVELRNTGDPELLDEFQHYITQLLDVTKKYNSHSLLAEAYLLQAKLALLTFDINEARRLLTQAQKISEKYGLNLLAIKISSEHDELLKQLEMWEKLKESKAPLAERMELSRLNEQMERMVKKRVVSLPKLEAEQPVLLTIMSKEGSTLLSNPFTADLTIDSSYFGEFLASCNIFCDQIFSETFDRVKFGQNTVLIATVDSFSICYMFQGQSYSARQKLIHFSEAVRKEPEIIKLLKDAGSKKTEIKVNEIASLEELIYDSFLSDPQQFQMPFKAYEGDEPFVFVSYSHTDRLQVYPIIDYLNKTGKNIWYDEGIPISEDWKKSIVENLERCSAFLVFITPHIIDSEYVRKEISFALKKRKPFFSVYLKETQLPSELEFEIGNIQFMKKYLIPETEFYKKLNRMLDPVLNK